MTETHWLVSSDPEEMFFRVVKPLKNSRRRMDLFCLACVRPLWHLLEDAAVKRPFEWLEEHAGERSRPASRGHVRELFQGPAIKLYQAHHRREPGVGGFAVHVAYDLWADWYEYAFPNFSELHADYPDALHENPRTYLSVIMRDIFGNPFRPTCLDPAWLTPTVTRWLTPSPRTVPLTACRSSPTPSKTPAAPTPPSSITVVAPARMFSAVGWSMPCSENRRTAVTCLIPTAVQSPGFGRSQETDPPRSAARTETRNCSS